jgi:hypothetical protein
MIYVDGFNFYYGAVRNTPYKWLNLAELFSRLLKPENEVVGIKYFTAMVSPRQSDPQQAARQTAYIRALQTLPNFQVIYGHFLSHPVKMPLASGKGFAEVIKTEEKGSDVNLATHLLVDAFRNQYDLAVLVTNDSDLAEPVRQIKTSFNKKVGILNPHKRPSRVLLSEATFFKSIRQSALAASQFPDSLTDVHGTITKPTTW